jgi:hypothetical protein
MGLMDILQNALGGSEPEKHFDQVTENASKEQLAAGITGALRSDETPPFGNMVGQLFGNSSSTQQAGLLNQILSTVGPAVAASLGGGILSKFLPPGQTQLTPDQASPAQVTEIASHAEQAKPSVVDKVGSFYAQHSGLIKTLGGVALMVTMAKMKEHAEGA